MGTGRPSGTSSFSDPSALFPQMRKTSSVSISASPFHDRQSGMALLVVLWTVALMVLLVITFSNSVQVEIRAATYRKEAAQAHALACGGVEAAILEIAYPATEDQKPSPIWTWQKGQRDGVVPFRGGRAELRIVNEAGKFDLNNVPQDQLARLFEARGLNPARSQGLAQAIVDWRSPPKNDTQDAATSEVNDRPRHAPFESLAEVLNVRGMSRGIFYGTAEVDEQGKVRTGIGIGRALTVRSRSAMLNVNYASEIALKSVPGINADLARAIIRERRREPFKTVAEINDRIAQSLPDEALPFLTTAEVNTYSIVSTGEVEGSPVRRTVEAIVQVAPEGALRYRILAWSDDYWNE
jgi:general secretion pathway protein K